MPILRLYADSRFAQITNSDLNAVDMGLADVTRLAIPALMFEVEAIAADRDGRLPSCDKV